MSHVTGFAYSKPGGERCTAERVYGPGFLSLTARRLVMAISDGDRIQWA